MLVQLVKSNANFPNLVYFLLYQKNIVANALQEEVGERGEDFLKKIVQVELEVPLPPDHKMRGIFGNGIERVLERAVIRWDKERWRELFEDAVWPYFRTPRDIKRFISVFDFYFEGHIRDGVLEVNPIDLLLVETLRMFDPEAYEAVSRAFQKHVNVFLRLLLFDKEVKEQFTLGIKTLVERPNLTDPERERLKKLLLALFPQGHESSFGGTRHEDSEWLRDLRICHGKHFAKYFQLEGDPGDISAGFIAKLFASGTDRNEYRSLFEQVFKAGAFSPVLERLWAAISDLPQDQIEPLVGALFDLSDNLPQIDGGLLSLSHAELELARLILALLNRIPDESVRAQILQHSVTTSSGITGPVLTVGMLESKGKESETSHASFIDSVTLTQIRNALLIRLWETARSGQLWKLRMAAALIFRLRAWAGIDEVKTWLTDELKNTKTAIIFLRIMLNESQVSGIRGTRKVYSLLGKQLEQFVELNQLADWAEPEASNDLEKAAIEKLRQAILNKKEGKPYEQIYVLSRDEDGKFLEDNSDAL